MGGGRYGIGMESDLARRSMAWLEGLGILWTGYVSLGMAALGEGERGVGVMHAYNT